MKKTGYVYSDNYLNHGSKQHPERPSRLYVINKYLQEKKLINKIIPIKPTKASFEEISLVHERAYIKEIEFKCKNKESYLDADTAISEESYYTALLAAGGVINAIDMILLGEIDNAFCAVRPPGHHAEKDRAMGFCLFNNAAIGAKYAHNTKKADKVFILDWDVHHGNGTQKAFYNNQAIFYVSIHQFPHYPGTGKIEETGDGEGKGFNFNFPVNAGDGDNEYLDIIEKKIYPLILNYSPDLIIISAGFDAHINDPLSETKVTTKGFQKMTKILVKAASKACGGKVLSILEGGYNLKSLGESVGYHISELLEIDL